jgi:Cu(I)/Ag(I) efflux system membrane fusion protein
MKLVPIESGAPQLQPAPHEADHEPAPDGYEPVQVSAEKQQLMGVAVVEAKEMELDQSIRTTGRVVPDETRTHHIHTKFDGYIEEIFANYVGQFVRKGDPLFSIYSPELLATQREYLLALRAREEMKERGQTGGIDLLDAARRRLALWDISDSQIDEIERTRQPIRAVMMRSHVSGYVMAKTAVHGLRVTNADNLYDIVDLSRVWVMADVYEVNAPFIRPGLPATIELPYESGRTMQGKVTYLDPVLDPASRTLKARIEVANPGNELKPEMYVRVVFGGTAVRGLVVPESAVISTGERMIVFIAKGEGRFQPREVTTGAKVRGYYEIRSGLVGGEQVVVSGNFLLDSESRLRSAISGAGTHH